MTYELVNIFPHDLLLEEGNELCISLYQPTHRPLPSREKNIIRFKNLLQQTEQSLAKKHDKKTIDAIMKPLYAIGDDRDFWRYIQDGLAIFATPEKCIVYKLNQRVNDLAIVANSFHLKPLIRIFQSADRYHLLGINRKEFSLFEGTRYQIEEVPLHPDIKNTFKKAIGEDFEEKIITATGSGPNSEVKIHGHGSKKDVIQRETEKFFRVVDNEVLTHFSQPIQLPVYLVALEEHHALFQQISKNKYLQKEGIKLDYQSLDLDKLLEAAWDLLEPLYIEKTYDLVKRFETARSQDKGSDDIAQIARAATNGRIERVLLEADRIYPGKVDTSSGELIDAQLDHPAVDDVLDDIAEIVFRQKGDVVVVPKERMPSATGAAAIYRY